MLYEIRLLTSCIEAWKKSSLSSSLLPAMFLRKGFSVRRTCAQTIMATALERSSLRRYWSSVSPKPPLLQANSPKTFKENRERYFR